jgi:hypothetical protein
MRWLLKTLPSQVRIVVFLILTAAVSFFAAWAWFCVDEATAVTIVIAYGALVYAHYNWWAFETSREPILDFNILNEKPDPATLATCFVVQNFTPGYANLKVKLKLVIDGSPCYVDDGGGYFDGKIRWVIHPLQKVQKTGTFGGFVLTGEGAGGDVKPCTTPLNLIAEYDWTDRFGIHILAARKLWYYDRNTEKWVYEPNPDGSFKEVKKQAQGKI